MRLLYPLRNRIEFLREKILSDCDQKERPQLEKDLDRCAAGDIHQSSTTDYFRRWLCRRLAARQTRSNFYAKHPTKLSEYRARTRAKHGSIGNPKRVFRRHPELPQHCEACGESRVLDIAHRPGFERKGLHRSAANTTPDKIWVLCPTCHALLDRLGYTAEQLGIRPRGEVMFECLRINLHT